MIKKNLKYLTCLFSAAFLARLLAYIVLGRIGHPVFWEYHNIALNFLSGRGLSYNMFGSMHYAYAEPLYPLFSAFVYWATNHNYLVFGVINILIASSIPVIVFFIARQLFDENTGFVSSILVAFHPGLIFFSTEFHPLTVNAFFGVAVMALLIRFSKTLRMTDAAICGLVIALAYLDRSTALLFIPLAALLLSMVKARAGLKLKLLGCIIAIALIAVTGWSIRNYAIFHRIVITRSSTGYLFWLGNNPDYKGSAMHSKEKSLAATLSDADQGYMSKMDELGQNAYLMNKAIVFVRERPLGFLMGWARKLYYFWWFSPQSGLLYASSWLFLYKMFYIFIAVSAAVALIAIYSNPRMAKGACMVGINFVLISCISWSILQSLFYVEGRHRWVLEPIVMIFSGWTIVHTYRFLTDKIKKG